MCVCDLIYLSMKLKELLQFDQKGKKKEEKKKKALLAPPARITYDLYGDSNALTW